MAKIYSTIMMVRNELNKLNLKKSGMNKFAGFSYFELADFLPQATELMNKHGVCPYIIFTNEQATMTVVNCENPEEQIQLTTPMRELSLKGTNEIQNLGGIQTYLTRYLYVQLLAITESDVFDATSGKDESKKSTKTSNNATNATVSTSKTLSDAQLKRLYAIASKAGYSSEKVKEIILKKYSKEPKSMTKQEYDTIVAGFESMINIGK